MNMTLSPLQFVRRSLALAAVLGAGVVVAQAQQTVTAAAEPAAAPTLNLTVPAADTAVFSSSADQNANVVAANHFDFLEKAVANAQPGSRRYGRPRYRGGNTNADGSAKYDFFAGVGFTQPVGNTYHYLTPSYSFQVGGGRQYSKNFAMNAQFDWDNFGFNGRTLNGQLALYNQIIGYYNATQLPANQVAPLSSLDGNTHIWSFSLDPTYTLSTEGGLGAYVVAGAGFYHKSAIFTVPTTGYYCDYYGYCYQYGANQTIDHYTSNAPGFNGGFGLTYKFSRFSNEKFFGEIRYVYVVNSQRPGVTLNTVNAANAGAYNDFPANSNRTSYFPVKFGLRF